MELDWDTLIPEDIRQNWIEFFKDPFYMERISFKTCLSPIEANGDPILIIFSDILQDTY